MLRPLGLGSFLTAVPAYRALRRAYRNAELVLAAPKRLAPLAKLTGVVDRVVDADPSGEFAEEVHGADVAVDLFARGAQGQVRLLQCSPKRLISFAHRAVPQTELGAPWYAEEHDVRRWCRMLVHAGIRADASDIRLQAPKADPRVERCMILHPGATSAARRWPLSSWIALGKEMQAAGYRLAVTGNDAARPLVTTLASALELSENVVFAGGLNGAGLASLVAGAEGVVSSDTGFAHLAFAFGKPSVTLYGPTPPSEWGPPRDVLHRAIWKGERGDPHADKMNYGLAAISVEEVLGELERLRDERVHRAYELV